MENRLAFDLLQALRLGGCERRHGHVGDNSRRQVLWQYDFSARKQRRPLHRIAQLAHIARPPIVQQTGRDRRGEA